MQEKTLRVVVASEKPAFRQMLAGLVEREPGAVLVGQADNSVKAMQLAATLRPQIALVDSELPYIEGHKALRLSRMSGLDTAVNISNELPVAAMVVADAPEGQTDALQNGEPHLWVYCDSASARMPVRLRDIIGDDIRPGNLLFGGIRLSAAAARVRPAEVADKLVMCGGVALMGGLGLMATLILAGAGIVVAGAGAVVLLAGFATKLALSIRRRQ